MSLKQAGWKHPAKKQISFHMAQTSNLAVTRIYGAILPANTARLKTALLSFPDEIIDKILTCHSNGKVCTRPDNAGCIMVSTRVEENTLF